MTLKTLANIGPAMVPFVLNESTLQSDYRFVDKKELIQTAIAWIKELEYKNGFYDEAKNKQNMIHNICHGEKGFYACECCESDKGAVDMLMDWIKYFFGITDKDLEDLK